MSSRKLPGPSLRAEAAKAIASDLGWHARLTARRVTGALDRALAEAELSSTQFGLMCLIAASPDDTVGALAALAGLSQSTMSRNLDQLVAAGLAELVSAEQDRRRRAVWLTERGTRQLLKGIALWRVAHRDLIRVLGTGFLTQLVYAGATLAAADSEDG